MKTRFYSNGKLLITAEYGVLDGALALAIPTKYGQYLDITPSDTPTLYWQSLDEKEQVWFTATFNSKTFAIKTCSNQDLADTLAHLLRQTKVLNPDFIPENQGAKVSSRLTFARNWGLGSSSTLINNLAQWASVNAHELLKRTFGGSGYDIACAQHHSPILYQFKDGYPLVEEITFDPHFKQQLYFVFLNQKQNSREAIANYRKQDFNKDALLKNLSHLTRLFLNTKRIKEFESHISRHEEILSAVLNIKPVKEQLFPDYFGAIKSLGGWGGDFVLVTGNEKTPDYFKAKGFDVVIPFDDMIL